MPARQSFSSRLHGPSPTARPLGVAHHWRLSAALLRHRRRLSSAARPSAPPLRPPWPPVGGRREEVHAAATPQRHAEPAWHRRARRKRGEARAWLRVASAQRLLEAHHSAQRCRQQVLPAMPDGQSKGKGQKNAGGKGRGGKGGGGDGKGGSSAGDGGAWDCHLCGLPANFGWRLRCRGCDSIRKSNRSAHGVPGTTFSADRGGQQPTLAERQLKQIREEQKRQRKEDEEEKRQLREALSRMRAEVEKKGKGREAKEEEDGDGDGEVEDIDDTGNMYSSWTEAERQKRLDEARGGLLYLVSKFGEDSEEASSTREEIASLQRASRDAKPFKAHRSLLERKRERLKDKQARDEAEVERITGEIDELQSKLKDLRSTVHDRAKQISQVEEELAELVRKALAEGEAAGAAGKLDEDPTTPWSAQAASAALQAMATKPGVPPEFAALLGHVYQAAQAMANAAASARPAASPPAPPPTEGGGQQSHRGDQQRQQQQSQQHAQPQQPSDTKQQGADQRNNTNKTAASVEGAGSISGSAPTTLAPQGRWTKGGGSAAGGGTNGTSNSGTSSDTNSNEMQIDAEGD